MKKHFFSLALLLLPGTLLAQTLRLNPEKPRPGQRLTLTYDPAGGKLANAPAVHFVVYHLRPMGEPIAQEISPTRHGGTFQATLTVPDTIRALAFVFEQNDTRESNGGQGYHTPLFGTDGQPVPGASAALAEMHLNQYLTVGLEDRDAEKARASFEEEFRRYPASKRQHLSTYLFAFSPRREEDRAALLREADTFSKLPNLTAEEMNAIGRAYQQAGKADLAKALTEKRVQQFGKSERDAYYELYRAFDNGEPMTLAQRDKAYRELLRRYPASPKPYHRQFREFAYDRYLRVLADSGKTAKFETLVKSAPAEYQSVTMNTYNRIAGEFIKKGTQPERAAELARRAVDWAKARLTDPRLGTDSPTLTLAQLRKNRERTYATYASTYGQVLSKQNKNTEALPYLEAAAKTYYQYQSPETNERYLTVLEAVHPAAVLAEAEAMTKAGKSTPAIEQLLHIAYTRSANRTVEYESYLAGLRKEAADRRRTDLLEKRIARPAPDFELVTLEGKSVRLADLKGKVVILDFWATWCGPCIASFPGMQKAMARLAGDPSVVFLFVNSWQQEADKRKTAADFIAKNGYPFTVLMDEKDEVISGFKVSGIPTKFVIDKTGTIRFRSVGYSFNEENLVDELATMIELAGETTN